MARPDLSEALIREGASGESFRRGREYHREGAVLSLVLRADILHAEVAGSEPETYAITVRWGRVGIPDADCTCPYEYGGWCKHIVAALLAYIDDPGSVEERPSPEELLAGLDEDELRSVILSLAERVPSLPDVLERLVRRLRSSEHAPSPRAAQPSGDAARPSPPPLPVAAPRLDEEADAAGFGVLREVWRRIHAGDAQVAIRALNTITEEYMEAWNWADDSDGDLADLFHEIGATWTQALLIADISDTQREGWRVEIDGWQAELDEYGVDGAFEAAQLAAEYGWRYPGLDRVLAGETPPDWECPAALAGAFLDVLDRQRRYDEYLRLADTAGFGVAGSIMLARLGRPDEATQYAAAQLTSPAEALEAATGLWILGRAEPALKIAEHGLDLDGARARLAEWTRDAASDHGRRELALEAAVIAVKESPTLDSYLRLRDLAGPHWPELRPAVLDALRRRDSYLPRGEVAIFLHEGLVEDAVAAVQDIWDDDLVGRVADAAAGTHADWVIVAAEPRAERIMDEGKAQRYDEAVEWLRRAMRAYRAAGREQEWLDYYEDLKARHRRKYKLLPMLESLEAE